MITVFNSYVKATLPSISVWAPGGATMTKLEKIFKKKHSCGFIFSKLCYTPIFLIHVHIFSIK